MFNAKIHKTGFEVILAACDSELLGSTLEEGDTSICLDEAFFGSESVSADELCCMLAMATSGNLVGKNVVDIAIRQGSIDPGTVSDIRGIPYAMFFTAG